MRQYQFYYKCTKPVIPEATFAIFIERNENTKEPVLEFKLQEDESHERDISGYIAPQSGDSGSPYWTHNTLIEYDLRATLVGVHSTGGKSVRLFTDPYYQCRLTATKIIDDILRWVKEKSLIYSSSVL